MSSAAKRGVLSRRYQLAKLYNAAEEFVHALVTVRHDPSVVKGHHHHHQDQAAQQQQQQQQQQWQQHRESTPRGLQGGSKQEPTTTPVSEAISAAIAKFREAYHQQMTSVMYMAGSAMAPALNRAALEDRDALEKLVVRNIPRPSPRSVLVGDVVAFNSPLALGSSPVVTMVRRVAAMEGDEMVAVSGNSRGGEAATEGEEDAFAVPKGHCWVLADNENLKPPQVCAGWLCEHAARRGASLKPMKLWLLQARRPTGV